MKLYKTKNGAVIEKDKHFFYLENEDWDALLNSDNLHQRLSSSIKTLPPQGKEIIKEIIAPIGNQEVWACGVTYLKSKIGRQEESKDAGGADFYDRVYYADRPEVFFKATPARVVGHNQKVRIRKDSTWDVPEPELTLVVNWNGQIIGYTIGNDMSSRSIEGENPLYLPQAKTYDGCAALGPCIYITDGPLSPETTISLEIVRSKVPVFNDSITISQMKRTFQELVSFVFRECSFPNGCFIMTGTGIVPGNGFTLQPDDEIRISIDKIGVLVNVVNAY